MAASKGKARRLALKDIRVDGGTQSRAAIHPETVEEYAEAMQVGAEFPPMTVYYDGKVYWLADGFHRYEAAQKAKFRTFPVEVKQGTQRDAILHSVGANSTHGLRRTNSDKRRAVEVLLRDGEWSQWSDREIARKVGVSQPFVGSLRKEIPTDKGYQSGLRKGADGRVIDTTRIGQKLPAWVEQLVDDNSWYIINRSLFHIMGPFPDSGQAVKGGNAMDTPREWLTCLGSYLKLQAVNWRLERFTFGAPKPTEEPPAGQAWQTGKFYPVNDKLKFVYDDPMDEGEITPAKQMWYTGTWYEFLRGESLQSRAALLDENWTIQPGRRPAPGSETEEGEEQVEEAGEDGEGVPQVDEPSPEHDPKGDGVEGHTKYHKGQAAICGKCEGLYEMLPEDATYIDWKLSWSPAGGVIWTCPRGHRVADSLMRLIEDELPEQPSPLAPRPEGEGNKIVVPEKFGVILADPPWKYEYPTTPYRQMSPAEMAGLPVGDLAAEDCALFMWATWPMVQQALNLGVAWGFEYTGVAAFVWVKLKSNLSVNSPILPREDEHWHAGKGTWTQTNTEFCLLFTRGQPLRSAPYVHQVIVAPVRKHSQKPDEQYERIEWLMEGPYLELFAREKREGWFAWGDEIESDIKLEAVEA